MTGQETSRWSALSPERYDSNSLDLLVLCSGHSSHVRTTRTKIGGNRSAPGPEISCCSGSCKLRSPILSAMKCRDPKTNLESGKTLVADSNDVNLT
jgi:hypothetical protein